MDKLIYIGSVELSYQGLDELIKQRVIPDLVVTLRPDLSHRHSDFDNLSQLARDNDIPVLYVNNINETETMAQLSKLAPDHILVIGWSQIIKPELLELPKKTCVGFHFAKLPKNRGRAAIPWVILNQEIETGVTLLHLDKGIDSGDILTQRTIPITADERARTLYDKVSANLRDMMREIAELLNTGKPLPRTPQDHGQATFLAKRVADDGWINWNDPADKIERLIRAVGKPYPGAFTIYKNRKLIIWEARLRSEFNHVGTIGQILTRNKDSVTVQCGEGWIDILLVEDEALEQPMSSHEYFTRIHGKLGINSYDLWKQVQGLLID